jgi:hypothetical protein
MSEEFNPLEWYDKAKKAEKAVCHDQSFPPKRINNPSIASEVDILIARIEAAFTDITTSYADWLNLGFAFASEFGDSGRKFYHRVSRFYNGYTKAETDKQYDQCLKSHGQGITIKTFFHLAKQAGIDIATNDSLETGDRRRENGDRKTENGDRQQLNESEGDGVCSMPRAPRSMPSFPVPGFRPTVSDSDSEQDPPEPQLPTLPDFIFDQVPDFFKRVVSRASSKEERDILLLTSIVTVGSCLTTFSGVYDETQVYPNLFFYVAARASSGKGRMILCRNLVNPIHWDKKKQNAQENQQYEMDIREYNAMKGKDLGIEKPQKPPVTLHFIPANNSTSGFLQLIGDNDGQGLIFETEGDTIAEALKTDYGNFSDALRRGFHQENISYYRKTDHEHVEIEQPRFSMILSSTMGQLKNLIPSTENGLSSRFLFYYMNLNLAWKDVFAHRNEKTLKIHFNELGQEFYCLYNTLRSKDPIDFSLADEQVDEFNAFFARMQDKYLVLQGLDYLAIVRRLGLIAFRIMMILNAMRIPKTGDFSVKQECNKEDFETSLAIIKILVRHASYIVSQMPAEVKSETRGNKKEKFFDALPEKFCRKEFLERARSLNIAERTADKYIGIFCDKGFIVRAQPNEYIRTDNR